MSLKAMIKAGAESLGFVAVGFTSLFPVPGLERYQDWIANGRQAGMDYLDSQRSLEARADPRQLLPSCRTVVSLLSCYPSPGDLRTERVLGEDASGLELKGDLRSESVLGRETGTNDRSESVLGHPVKIGAGETGTSGRIAAYALLPDYHEVLKAQLEKLAGLIVELTEGSIETYACVDSAPILEKGYAQTAGLGWIGRNSLLLHSEFGSWTHLSELLISLEVEPDQPMETDGCGDCQLCVRACPTQAILPCRSVDARRCISYLTIENRGQIPVEFRKAVGKRIFGCDQCQSVCPVNKKARTEPKTTVIEEFPDLAKSFRLSAEDFSLKYGHTPVWRAKYSGFRRNLVIAMGNSGQKQFTPLLEHASKNENDPIIVDAIRWAIEELV